MPKKPEMMVEPGRQEFFVTREVDAPRELVFRAFMEPALVLRWLGPRRYKMTLEAWDPRPGGRYRYTHEAGNERWTFHGVFHEVAAPSRIIQTFEFGPLPEPGHVSLETAEFHELPGGRTRILTHSVYLSVADRDGMLQGMGDDGMDEVYERLDELLEDLKRS